MTQYALLQLVLILIGILLGPLLSGLLDIFNIPACLKLYRPNSIEAWGKVVLVTVPVYLVLSVWVVYLKMQYLLLKKTLIPKSHLLALAMATGMTTLLIITTYLEIWTTRAPTIVIGYLFIPIGAFISAGTVYATTYAFAEKRQSFFILLIVTILYFSYWVPSGFKVAKTLSKCIFGSF